MKQSRWLNAVSVSLLAAAVGFAAGALAPRASAATKGDSMLVYFGTYTGKKSRGIYVARFDAGSGRLSAPELAAEIASPSFLAAHPKGGFLYAVNEVGNYQGQKAGAVSAFAIDAATGKLSLLNQQSSGGGGPCHLVTDKKGRNVLVANYSGGSVAALPVRQDGALEPASAFVQHLGSSVNPRRQEAPHAHGIYLDAANRFVYVPDLGLDKVLIYRFDARQGTLTANDPSAASVAPGAGPRHFAFHPKGRFAYVINEITCTVTAFACDPKRGALTELQTLSTLPVGETVQPGYSTAELFTHPSGKFLYGSNRGHDTIVTYAIDAKTGRLTLVGHTPTQGKIPRSFGLDPTGRWLLAANQNSDTVVVFSIEPQTGRLTPTGQTVEVGAPVAVEFVRAR
jgi:6-phosphogluconolactonase